MKKLHLLIILIALNLPLFSQSLPFEIYPDTTIRIKNILVNENNKIGALYYPITTGSPSFALETDFIFSFLDSPVAHSFHTQNPAYEFLTLENSIYTQNLVFNLQTYAPNLDNININYSFLGLSCFNRETEEIWTIRKNQTNGISNGKICFSSQNELIFAHSDYLGEFTQQNPNPTTDSLLLNIIRISTEGNILSKSGLNFILPPMDSILDIIVSNCQANQSGEIYVSGKFSTSQNSDELTFFVNKYTPTGEIITSKKFPNYTAIGNNLGNEQHEDLKIDSQGNIYFLGKSNSSFPFTDNENNAILVKMDSDFNIIWTKVYHAEKFEFNKATITIVNDNKLVLGYSTYGAFPVILTELNSEGDIQSEIGYPYFQPDLDIMPDGSLLMEVVGSIVLDSNNNFVNPSRIIKTDTLGNLDICETYPACISAENIIYEIENLSFEDVQVRPYETFEMIHETFDINYTDYCNNPEPPNPYFVTQDFYCYDECVQTDSTYNELANGIEWHLTNDNGLDSLWKDSLTLTLCNLPTGDYTLKHSVWFLGCEYDFSRTFSVFGLDNQPNIQPRDTICIFQPTTLTVTTLSGNLAYLWNTGESTQSIIVNQSGNYAVTISQEDCSLSDTVNIYIYEEFLEDIPIILPPDTVVCLSDFPITLRPQSVYSELFFVENQSLSNTQITLNEAGNYLISTEIEGCIYSESYQITLDDCRAKVYLPNVFSPNDDGINDIFEPLGENFQSLELSIFDRWGNLLFRSRDNSPHWDGKIKGEFIDLGVLVTTFRYLNTRTKEEGIISGDLTVLR